MRGQRALVRAHQGSNPEEGMDPRSAGTFNTWRFESQPHTKDKTQEIWSFESQPHARNKTQESSVLGMLRDLAFPEGFLNSRECEIPLCRDERVGLNHFTLTTNSLTSESSTASPSGGGSFMQQTLFPCAWQILFFSPGASLTLS